MKREYMKKYIIEGDPVPLARPRFAGRRIYDSQKNLKVCARPAVATTARQ
jgi:hypothetical protein